MCRSCPRSSCVNLKEEKELAMIEEGLTYNDKQKPWTTNCPRIRDPEQLKINLRVAVARLRMTENSLIKLDSDYGEKYQNTIEDMIRRGVARKLSDEEIRDYKGMINYIHHHEVLKPESMSTPLCIVFNSSASYMGQSLNEF